MNVRNKYLQHYAEPEARALLDAGVRGRWRQVLVVPAYAESPDVLRILPSAPDSLLILVLNRPETDPDMGCNDALRQHAMALPEVDGMARANAKLLALPDGNQVLLMERSDALPRDEGVGLARKIGCDAALALITTHCIVSRWIHCTDADATLPADYFCAAAQCLSASALTYPFRHTPPADPRECIAMDVYERYLQHYVDGLHSAGSPYAFHTLGSCIAVDATAYSQVRGFPRRAGGEDFYLLNKLAKLGTVTTPDCSPIRLSARISQRAPFGTGPALGKLLEQPDPEQNALFYDPHCFACLRELIACIEQNGRPGMDIDELLDFLEHVPELRGTVQDLGIAKFLVHAGRQCASRKAFRQQFHQWFDGFRTRKLIHALSEKWGRVSLQALESVQLQRSAAQCHQNTLR